MSQFDNFEVCDHPFPPFIPNGCRTLIVGTFPTHQRNYRLTFPFYYAGDGNVFWDVISKVFQYSFAHFKGNEAKEERERLLKAKCIGLTDILERCYRRNGLSQDEHIYPILWRDLFTLLKENKTITTLVFTSRSKIVGTRGLFETYLHQRNFKPPSFWENSENILEAQFTFEQREIEILVPFSTSKTVIEKKRATVSQLVKMYHSCLT